MPTELVIKELTDNQLIMRALVVLLSKFNLGSFEYNVFRELDNKSSKIKGE